mgnify:FL=1
MENVIQTQDLGKRYLRCTALQGLTMQIPKGSIYGLVGKNGAGKTTLIRILTGLQQPTSGQYSLYGVPHTDPDILRCRRRMGAVVETPSLYLNMTAQENLRLQYRVLGLPSEDSIPQLLELVGLGRTGSKKVRNFSLGMRQRLGIAVALAGSPDLLLLDEPANGLDPQGIIELRELILKLNREQGITVLISSHLLDELARLASWYGFMDGGRILRQMSAQELEAACRKSTQITVSDPQILAQVLDTMGLEYTLLEGNSARLYGTVEVTPLVCALAEAGCRVRTMTQQDESLESFYMNLVGGSTHG